MKIDSPGNETIKKYASLKEKKFRSLYGLYLIEGARIVRDAILSGAAIDAVFVSEGSEKLLDGLGISGDKTYIVSEKAFNRLSDTETPQGIIAAAKIPLNTASAFCGKGLLLDGISDSGNLGTLIRSAAGFGYKDIYLINCADAYSPKTVRSTMGGIFRVNIRECGHEIIAELKTQRIQLIAADMGGKDASAVKSEGGFVLCIGSEAHGLSREIRAAADITAAIKQQSIESLNAAVAGSILMYLFA